MERDTTTTTFPLGSQLPEFSLLDVNGEVVSSEFLRAAPASLVVFSCNHCPYVKGSEEMLLSIVRRFQPQGLRVVAINSNDATKYPEDSFEKMREKATEFSLPYPYLYDESQDVARAFDAACTPEMYLFDRDGKLAYHGTISDSPRDPSKVTKDYLSEAITAVLEGAQPPTPLVHCIGCSIKWK
jgi:peroxiredoxin